MKPMIGKGSKFIGYTFLASFLFWFLLFFFHHSNLINFNTQVSLSRIHFLDTYESYSVQTNQNEIKQTPKDLTFNVAPIPSNDTKALETEKLQQSNISVEKQPTIANVDSDYEPCSGRYIYVHNLPSRYNEDLIRHCDSLSEWTNMCIFLKNFGFGPPLRDAIFRSSSLGWFHTNQFMLEVIFHNRIKAYKCLTNDSSLASAIFVPYYAGLDVAKYLWDSNPQMKDYNPNNLTKWLREQPEWKKLGGRDHFLVAGRITWDFRRQIDDPSDWGNKLMILPESKNMTILTIESSPWHRNDFAVPYPSYFHPSTDKEVYRWQNRMKKIRRRYLFSFVGGPRPNKNTIRGMIIHQCLLAGRHCKLLECENKPNKCDKPVNVMKFFQSSTFCLQPQGDSYTRRSTFDSILAGCIPVFFHPGSAYVQYLWHFPKDYTKYSVFIPEEEVRNGKTSIERILNGIPKQKRIAMREQVMKLIPGVVYAYPNNSMDLKDAFDISVDGVIERIEGIRKELGEGKNVDEKEEVSWKKYLFGTTGEHEWDHFFRVQ